MKCKCSVSFIRKSCKHYIIAANGSIRLTPEKTFKANSTYFCPHCNVDAYVLKAGKEKLRKISHWPLLLDAPVVQKQNYSKKYKENNLKCRMKHVKLAANLPPQKVSLFRRQKPLASIRKLCFSTEALSFMTFCRRL